MERMSRMVRTNSGEHTAVAKHNQQMEGGSSPFASLAIRSVASRTV